MIFNVLILLYIIKYVRKCFFIKYYIFWNKIIYLDIYAIKRNQSVFIWFENIYRKMRLHKSIIPKALTKVLNGIMLRKGTICLRTCLSYWIVRLSSAWRLIQMCLVQVIWVDRGQANFLAVARAWLKRILT